MEPIEFKNGNIKIVFSIVDGWLDIEYTRPHDEFGSQSLMSDVFYLVPSEVEQLTDWLREVGNMAHYENN